MLFKHAIVKEFIFQDLTEEFSHILPMDQPQFVVFLKNITLKNLITTITLNKSINHMDFNIIFMISKVKNKKIQIIIHKKRKLMTIMMVLIKDNKEKLIMNHKFIKMRMILLFKMIMQNLKKKMKSTDYKKKPNK